MTWHNDEWIYWDKENTMLLGVIKTVIQTRGRD